MVSFILDFSVIVRYSPGDVLMIQPHNMADTVEEFMDLLHLTPDAQFTLQQNDPGTISHHPQVASLCVLMWVAIMCCNNSYCQC